jgi:hypothetical protein
MVRRIDRRLGSFAALALLIASACADSPAVDPRLQENSALAQVHARDPEAAKRILTEIDAILASRNGLGEVPGGARGLASPPEVEDPAYRSLLDENPLLKEAYRINPKAVLLQLREIVSLGAGSRD